VETGSPRVFAEDGVWSDPVALDDLDPLARKWAVMRMSRSPASHGAFHGLLKRLPSPNYNPQPTQEYGDPSLGPTREKRDPSPFSVSALETYLGCPFRFFA